MNIIINGFHDKTYLPIVNKVLSEFKVTYCEFLYNDKFTFPAFTVGKVHSLGDITWGNYGVDINQLTPLDEKIIRDMVICEVDVLRMMDRLSIYNDQSYSQRKHLYLAHLRYWNHIINEKKIDFFLSSNIPHEVYDYIIYKLCKIKEIPTIFLHQNLSIPDVTFIMDDHKEFMIEIKEKYSELKNKYNNTPFQEIILSDSYESYFDSQTDKNGNVTPFYMKKEFLGEIEEKNKGKKSFKIFKLFNVKIILRKIKTKIKLYLNDLKKNKVHKFYELHTTEPDLEKKYIYVALQYQPELSTSPLAETFVDQILLIQLLSYVIPKDIYLYVKEHPVQKLAGICRDITFYKDIINLPNVKLIKTNFSSFQLLKNSMAVATCTGTPGWEALFQQKPVLMFGHQFYQYADGVFQIKSINDAKSAINKVFQEGYKADLKDIKIFLKSVEASAVKGYIDSYYKRISNLTEEENIKNISQALIARIYKIISDK
jgi:hypothetical protein